MVRLVLNEAIDRLRANDSSFTELYLSRTNIGDEGAIALA
eukprot:CAMPEP_0116153490 /NCGR_PEP_ID=MMETSP0329-20121206/21274_1 /TAXON_ID=697910 /ORGANISM="Pseudo-nitzschia arenysensis, Strain B593" /LENGTH=39 /DNA_ID= /DNA_START= /DNA_END= /DNA_ORIENTATION=